MKGIFKILPFLLTLAGCSKGSAPQTRFSEISIATNNEECLIYPAMLGLFTAELPEGQLKPKVTVSIDCQRSSEHTLEIQVGVEMFVPRMSEPDLRFYGQAESHSGGDLSRFELMHLLGGLIAQASQIAATKYRIEKDDDEVLRVLKNPLSVPRDVLLAAISSSGERKIEKAKQPLFDLLTFFEPGFDLLIVEEPGAIEVAAWALLRYEDEEVIKVFGKNAMSDENPIMWLELLCLAKAVEQEKISDAAGKALVLLAEQHQNSFYRSIAQELASGCSNERLMASASDDASLRSQVRKFVESVWRTEFMERAWHLRGGIEILPTKDDKHERKSPKKQR
jgi:hypothetical protein